MCVRVCVHTHTHAQLCPILATPWTVASQTPLFMGFFRQEYWSVVPCPSPGDLLNPGMDLSAMGQIVTVLDFKDHVVSVTITNCAAVASK